MYVLSARHIIFLFFSIIITRQVYAVASNSIRVVKEILLKYKNSHRCLLSWRFPKEGVADVGIPGHTTCLYGAMCFASAEIVCELLKNGADFNLTDNTDTDPLMAACALNRLDNVCMYVAFERKHHKEKHSTYIFFFRTRTQILPNTTGG